LIHHTGKDATRGARGHSSLAAALDAVIEVKRTQEGREWVLVKSKDGADGISRAFRLEVVNLGFDNDAEITSCVAVPDSSAIFAKQKLTGKHQISIWDAIADQFKSDEEIPESDLYELARSALSGTSNKGVRIKESIQALTDKGYLRKNDGSIYVVV
jgi:hypothetical protein